MESIGSLVLEQLRLLRNEILASGRRIKASSENQTLANPD